MKYPKDRIDSARAALLELCPPGTTVYTVLNHVSRSGMSRDISPYVIKDNEPRWIGGYAAVMLGEPVTRRDGIKMNGCGTDMGFELVYQLAYKLFPTGHGCIGENCPSNDHNNGDRDYTPHWHTEGGYALRHRWM